MSRLFEGFDDDADKVALPSVPLFEPDMLDDVILADAGFPLRGETELEDELELTEALVAATRERAPVEDTVEPPRSIVLGGYEIPDFERDEREVAAYEDAQKRHLRAAISSAETAIQTSFKAKREGLTREIKASRSFEEERRATALYATRRYAQALPHRVDKRGVNPPSFWENLFSLGGNGRLYREAILASAALEELRTSKRKREEQLDALEGQLNRALILKEEALKKAMETEAGLAEFRARPEIASLHKRVERINRERADYQARLERNEVSSEEQRDRAMSEHKLSYASLPLTGAIVAKVARFGTLAYFQLRDLAQHESLLSYDPRLDPLRNSVFDVYSVAGAVAAKLRRNDNGTAFRVADHFKACWRNQAEELYGKHRAALREDRGLPAMEPRSADEAEIIERLAALAVMVEGGPSREPTQAALGAPTVRP